MTSYRPRWPTIVLAWIALVLGQGAFAQGPATPADGAQGVPAQGTGTPASPSPPSPASLAAPASAWHTVTGPEKTFTADLPAAPKYTTTQMKTGTGSLFTVHQYLLEEGDVAYILQTAVYPEDINVSNPRVNLQGGLDNLAKGMEGAKWASVDWVTHQGLAAIDAVGLRSGHAIRSFSVMKGRQVFTLIYAGAPGTARSADVNRFVSSLRVGP
jgi:hypothetical protein